MTDYWDILSQGYQGYRATRKTGNRYFSDVKYLSHIESFSSECAWIQLSSKSQSTDLFSIVPLPFHQPSVAVLPCRKLDHVRMFLDRKRQGRDAVMAHWRQ